jgi:RNA polymerase sigma-70 factor (ECF subfamily)
MPARSPSEEAAHAAGQAQWPDVALDMGTFCTQARRAGWRDDHLQTRGPEFFLVAAILAGNAQAIEHFDHQFLIPATEVVTRIDSSADFVAEVRQQMRVKLFLGDGSRLSQYGGAGLLEWLRVIALRTALNCKRSDRRLVPNGELGERLLDSIDLERDAVKDQYLDDLRRALEASFRALEPRARTLLRLHFVEGLSIDAIGNIYGAHRATVARWIVAIRNGLFEAARTQLAGARGLNSQTLRSIYRILKEDLHLTVARVLKSEPGA